MPEQFSKIKVDTATAGLQLKLADAEKASLREHATQAARACEWIANKRCAKKPRELFRHCARRLHEAPCGELFALKSGEPSDDLQWLYDNLRLVRTDIQDLESGTKILAKLPAVRTDEEDCVPRPVVLGRELLAGSDYRLTESNFFFFIQSVEEVEPLRLAELGAMLYSIYFLSHVLFFHAVNEFKEVFYALPPQIPHALPRSRSPLLRQRPDL